MGHRRHPPQAIKETNSSQRKDYIEKGRLNLSYFKAPTAPAVCWFPVLIAHTGREAWNRSGTSAEKMRLAMIYIHIISRFFVTFSGAEGMFSFILFFRVKCGLEPPVCFYPLDDCSVLDPSFSNHCGFKPGAVA